MVVPDSSAASAPPAAPPSSLGKRSLRLHTMWSAPASGSYTARVHARWRRVAEVMDAPVPGHLRGGTRIKTEMSRDASDGLTLTLPRAPPFSSSLLTGAGRGGGRA